MISKMLYLLRAKPLDSHFKVRSHSLSSCKNLLHTTFWNVQLFRSYSKTSCMNYRQFSIKVCHSSRINSNSVCPGDSKLRELSLNHIVSLPLWIRALVGSNLRQNVLFLLLIRRDGFSWQYPVCTQPKRLALFEMRKMTLKGRKSESWLKSLASKCCIKQRIRLFTQWNLFYIISSIQLVVTGFT